MITGVAEAAGRPRPGLAMQGHLVKQGAQEEPLDGDKWDKIASQGGAGNAA